MIAVFVSVWDDGATVIRTRCNFENGIVSDADVVDVQGVDIVTDQYIELPDGGEIRDFKMEGDDGEIVVLIAKGNQETIKKFLPAVAFHPSTEHSCYFHIQAEEFERLLKEVRAGGYNPFALMAW